MLFNVPVHEKMENRLDNFNILVLLFSLNIELSGTKNDKNCVVKISSERLWVPSNQPARVTFD